MKTLLFLSYKHFLRRTDKNVNGILIKGNNISYNEYEAEFEDNSTNKGCWECRGCTNCTDCVNCRECTYCVNLKNSIDCEFIDGGDGCSHCSSCRDIKFSDSCIEVSHSVNCHRSAYCYNCKAIYDCLRLTDCEYMTWSKNSEHCKYCDHINNRKKTIKKVGKYNKKCKNIWISETL